MVTSIKYEYMDETIDEDLKCTICHKPLIDPVSAPCRHAFCRQCINDHLLNQSSCSKCYQPLSSNNLVPMILFVCKILDNLLVKCVNCEQIEIKRCEFDDHIEEICPKTLVSCSAADIRCPWKGRTNQLSFHTTSCDYERLRPILTELINENNDLKRETCPWQMPKTTVEEKSNSIQDQHIEHSTIISQLTEEVNFLQNAICHQNERLEKLISQSGTYSELELRKKNLIDLDMGIIVQKLLIAHQCTALQLQANKISDHGISLLVHALCNNTTLTKLNISYNPISDVGIRSLASLLATNNTKIQKLYLASAQITDQGMHYLGEMLITNTTLKSLGIFGSQFTDKGVEMLACALGKHNRSLTHLYIETNLSVTDSSVASLIEMLNSNQSLRLIGLKECGFSRDGIRRLEQVANKKTSFELCT